MTDHRSHSFDKYGLLAQLGRGGMADVYLTATQGPDSFSKLTVLKVLQEHLVRDPRYVDMFRQEARLAARLNHPNVVQTYEVGERQGRPFMAMEYLEGQPLSRVASALRASPQISVAAALRITIDALNGLRYVHELCEIDGTPLCIVHRDITPQNLFVTYEGQVKIVDFGIAKSVDSDLETEVGTVKGKIAYMAPEQARGEAVDQRADIFSVGVLLWEMLAGRRMWGGLTDVTVVAQLVEGQIPHLSTIVPELPEGLAAITARALSLNPTSRPESAQQLQSELEGVFDTLSTRISTRSLGEMMRKLFQDDRARARTVIRKQLKRIGVAKVVTPTNDPNDSPPSSEAFFGEMPSLGEGSIVHDAVTTIETNIGFGARRGGGSEGAYAVTSLTDTALLHQNRRIVWVALAAVGLAGLAVGTAQPWKSPLMAQNDANNSAASLGQDAPVQWTGAAATLSEAPRTQHESNCLSVSKPRVELTGELNEDAVLTCDKDYLLRFTTYVTPGVTLRIEAGTTIFGDVDTRGILVVQPEARIEARGTKLSPIVFTSSAGEGFRKPGDWGGLLILGRAPLNLRDLSGANQSGVIEGITRGGQYGGQHSGDSSGELSFVRIEYSGTEIAPNNEINGLTLGGVGRGTILHHIQVRHTADDCFEFFGGTVDAKYLVCHHPGDDAFDWDYGYTGRLQFLLAQMSPSLRSGSNGLEGDNDPNGSQNTPISAPSLYNFTLCGKNLSMTNKEHFGLLLRRASRVRIRNGLFMGFDSGLDVRDVESQPNIAASVFFNNSLHNLAYPEASAAPQGMQYADDDAGFNELVYLSNEGLRISQRDPYLGDCFSSENPDFKPQEAMVREAAIPPKDGFFDAKAQYIGAFRDKNDNWDEGTWLKWGE